MIHWPAIIQYASHAELGYVPDQRAWESDPHLQTQAWQPTDRLIDSRGVVHALRPGVLPQPTAHIVALDELLHIVRAHAAQAGLCCTAKLSAPSIAEAVRLVGTLHED